MTKEYTCSYCNSYFQDGEFIAVENEGGFYHTLNRHFNEEPMTCLRSAVFNGQLEMASGNNYLYYQRKLYDFSAIDKLANSQQLRVDFNENQNGDRLIETLKI